MIPPLQIVVYIKVEIIIGGVESVEKHRKTDRKPRNNC